MKHIIIILIIAFSIPSVAKLSGQALIDSLETELENAKADTNHVNLLQKISFAYENYNPDKGIEYGIKGVKLSDKLNWKEGLAGSFNSIGVNYESKSDYKKALEYYEKALKINEEIGNKLGIAQILGNIGVIYNSKSNYPKALKYYQNSLEINDEIGNKSGKASNLANIGANYHQQSNYPMALKYYQKALEMYEEIGHKAKMGVVLGNIGSIYRDQLDYSKALDYNNRALNFDKELGNKSGIAVRLGNIGIINSLQENYQKAIDSFEEALTINEELGRISGIAHNLANIGMVYKDKSDYLKSLEYFARSLKMAEEIGNKFGIAFNVGNMGSIYLKLSEDSVSINGKDVNKFVSSSKTVNLNNSIKYLEDAINRLTEIGELSQRSTFLKDLAEAYGKKGDFKKAYVSHIEHKKLQDSVFNQDKAKEIGRLEAEREQLEADYALQEAERIRKEEIDRRNTLQYSIISIVTVIIFGIIFYFVRRNVSFGAIDTLTFVAFLLLYEFILVVSEPWVDDFTDEVPIYKLLINIGIALILIPLQKIEQKIKSKSKNE